MDNATYGGIVAASVIVGVAMGTGLTYGLFKYWREHGGLALLAAREEYDEKYKEHKAVKSRPRPGMEQTDVRSSPRHMESDGVEEEGTSNAPWMSEISNKPIGLGSIKMKTLKATTQASLDGQQRSPRKEKNQGSSLKRGSNHFRSPRQPSPKIERPPSSPRQPSSPKVPPKLPPKPIEVPPLKLDKLPGSPRQQSPSPLKPKSPKIERQPSSPRQPPSPKLEKQPSDIINSINSNPILDSPRQPSSPKFTKVPTSPKKPIDVSNQPPLPRIKSVWCLITPFHSLLIEAKLKTPPSSPKRPPPKVSQSVKIPLESKVTSSPKQTFKPGDGASKSLRQASPKKRGAIPEFK